MVTIVPIPIKVLITSPALTANSLAKSPTVMVSGISTSRLTGSVGIWKPCSPLAAVLDARRWGLALRRLLFGATCSSSR